MPSQADPEPRPIVVAGAGAAGLAAAIAAARLGRQVLLVEASNRIGGTVTQTLIHTLGGLFDSAGRLLNPGLPAELVERLKQADPATRPRRIGKAWVLDTDPHVYQKVVQAWLAELPAITVVHGSRIAGVHLQDGRLIELDLASPHGARTIHPAAVIDATGTAEVARRVNPALVRDPVALPAGGFIIRLRGAVPNCLRFPGGLGLVRQLRQAAAQGDLPPECATVWLDTGLQADEIYIKWAIPLPTDWRDPGVQADLNHQADQTRDRLVRFLQTMSALAHTHGAEAGTLGIRDGGRIVGDYMLTEQDVRAGRRFPDAIARCCWPIELWSPAGDVSLDYLPPDSWYEIPPAALKVRGITNLWAAGKCLSADAHAQASARVVGSCWAMGEAAAIAAAS